MSKDKLISILDSSFEHGTPFIDYTEHYVYALIPTADGWNEVSYDIEGKELDEKKITAARAFNMLIEEVEKGISMEIKDFMLGTFKDFRKALGDKPDQEKLTTIIKELTENKAKYSESLPIITSKDELDLVKSKL